jgi:hypothetical protein
VERQFEIILPAVDNDGNKIRKELLSDVAQEIAERFGGVTVFPVAAGCYVPEASGHIHCDQNVVLQAVRLEGGPAEIEDDEVWMDDLAHRLGEEFGQELIFEQQNTATISRLVPGRFQKELPPSMLSGARQAPDVLAELIP